VPRPRRTSSARLSPSQAQQILETLIKEGRISAGDLNRYVEIQQLEERLQSLRGGGGMRGRRPSWRAAAPAASAAPARARGGRRRRRRGPITAEQLASRQLQGRYLGLIRQIPASQRARYAKVAKDRGRESAIKEMQSALKK